MDKDPTPGRISKFLKTRIRFVQVSETDICSLYAHNTLTIEFGLIITFWQHLIIKVSVEIQTMLTHRRCDWNKVSV